MATTFKIHLDEENLPKLKDVKAKEVKATGKRNALAPIQTNNASETFRNASYATKSDILSRELSALSTGFTENIKNLGIKEKKNVKPKTHTLAKELRTQRGASVKPSDKVESPMSIDTSPLVKLKLKENLSKPSNKLTNQTPTKTEGKVSSKTDKHSLVVTSPMSIDASPAHISLNESVLSELDDLHGYHVYKEDIFKYLRKLEEEYRPKAYYMRRQPDVTYSMRTILVDWLVEVTEEFKLKNETLFMTVAFIDRFLSSMAVAKPKLQLLGTSAMFIASKYEEIYPPEVGEFTYITDNSYTVKQLLRMERLILKVLSFDLSCPTSYTFLMHISSCVKVPPKILFLAMFLCELTLLEADPYLDFYPSVIACGAIALARRCLDYSDVWPVSLAKVTGYTFLQLGPVINHLNETHQKSFTSSHIAIRQKYAVAEYEYVSQIPAKKLVLRDSF